MASGALGAFRLVAIGLVALAGWAFAFDPAVGTELLLADAQGNTLVGYGRVAEDGLRLQLSEVKRELRIVVVAPDGRAESYRGLMVDGRLTILGEDQAPLDVADVLARERRTLTLVREGEAEVVVPPSAGPEVAAEGRAGAAAGGPGGSAGEAAAGERPGRAGDAPGRSGDAPGRSGDAPGRSGEAPGHGGEPPGRSGDAPGRSSDAPAGGDDGASTGGSVPGEVDDGSVADAVDEVADELLAPVPDAPDDEGGEDPDPLGDVLDGGP